jgi:hypothetical protein
MDVVENRPESARDRRSVILDPNFAARFSGFSAPRLGTLVIISLSVKAANVAMAPKTKIETTGQICGLNRRPIFRNRANGYCSCARRGARAGPKRF